MGHPNPYGKHRSDNGPGRLQSHPLLTIDCLTGMVTFANPKHPNELFCVHPLQILPYLDYDKEVWQMHGCPHCPMPLDFLPTFVNPHLELLVMLGFISRQGNIDKETVEDAVHAWHAPSSQQVQRTKHQQSGAHAHSSLLVIPQKRVFKEAESLADPSPLSVASSSNHCNKRQILKDNRVLPYPSTGTTSTSTTSTSTTSTSTSSTCSSGTVPAASPPLANSSHAASKPVTSKGIIIKSPDRKGKGKAIEPKVEPEDIVMTQACRTPLPEDADAEGELMDYPEDA
ncbi:hypothetical protein C0995_012201 [Termitomyces sp. Mi166|nr:hypothetical protein C0995_012201 [Termitomyces sp. Mi166\